MPDEQLITSETPEIQLPRVMLGEQQREQEPPRGKCYSMDGDELDKICGQYNNSYDCTSNADQSCEWEQANYVNNNNNNLPTDLFIEGKEESRLPFIDPEVINRINVEATEANPAITVTGFPNNLGPNNLGSQRLEILGPNILEVFSDQTTMLGKFYKCTKRPKKPDDWEDEPMIIDPTAEKPDDWNDDINGAWTPPIIDNINYKGDWETNSPPAPLELIIQRIRINLEIIIPELDNNITRDFFENLEYEYESFEEEMEEIFELLELGLEDEDEDIEQIKTEKDMYRKLILSELSGDLMREEIDDYLLNKEQLDIFLREKAENNEEVQATLIKLNQLRKKNISNTIIVSFNRFIDNLSSNIADEMIGETNLVCENYLENTQEDFVGDSQENQSNKIMKTILFALLFYIIKSEQVQSILKKMLENLYKTHSTEHLLIVSMIVFAILYYVINLFI